MGKAIEFSGYSKSDLLIPFAISVTVTLSFYNSQIVSKFPSLYLYLFFYSFDYTIKSGGVCNRLLVYYQSTTLTCQMYHKVPVLVTYPLTTLTDSLTDSVNYPFLACTFSCIYRSSRATFTIKSLMQFFTTLQSLQVPIPARK